MLLVYLHRQAIFSFQITPYIMNHTEKQNDSALSNKSGVTDSRRAKPSNSFELPPVTGLPPEGFITGEEFTKRAMKKVRKFCDENGIL